jgi:predicted nuclease of predicted toxin-antitoxin system
VRVLLDENLPQNLRLLITGHRVETVRYNGWDGFKNGELLETAEADGVEVLVTGDRNMLYQQSMTGRKIAVITLSAQNWQSVRDNVHKIQVAVDNSTPGSFQAVDCGTFSRRRTPGRD